MNAVHLGLAGDAATDLSAIVAIEDDLWVASDETTSLVRLKRSSSGDYELAETVELTTRLDLPVPDASEEFDIEGLDFHGEHLWLIGSHSLKRKDPETDKKGKRNLERLLTVEADGNRFLVARVPAKAGGGQAAQLDCGPRRSDLSDVLRQEEYFKRFFAEAVEADHARAIAGKDNGFDVEGLAVAGPNRIFIGMRGPVLRGWAVILELQFEEGAVPGPEGSKVGRLRLKSIGPGDAKFRKTFVRLDGLGIRELCFDGDDLLILAGPSMDLDWPVTIYRWVDARKESPKKDRLVWQKSDAVEELDEQQSATLEPVAVDATPTSEKGKDHAEGLALIAGPNGGKSLLVIYDSPASVRLESGTGVTADLFDLPGTGDVT